MEQKIKDFIGVKAIYDHHGQNIFGEDKDGKLQVLVDLRGWGAISNLYKDQVEAMKFQDALGEWIVTAINSKLNN